MDLPSAQPGPCWGWRVGESAPPSGSLVLLQHGHPYLNQLQVELIVYLPESVPIIFLEAEVSV